MKPAPVNTQEPDPFAAYFASVALALLASGWIAGLLIDQFVVITSAQPSDTWRINATAGLFLGTVFANPIGAIVARTQIWRVGIRFLIGIATGLLVQTAVFTPFAGDGMSNFLFLLLAGSAVPVSMFLAWANRNLQRRGVAPLDLLGKLITDMLGWSDRLIFILLMGISFAAFWYYTSDIAQVLIVLVLVLATVVTSVARREAQCEYEDDLEEVEYQAWLALEPDETAVDPMRDALAKLRKIALTLLPGAILFGGMIRLAMEFLWAVYPSLQLDVSKPFEALQNIGIVAASGLAAVLFGMMATLGICLVILRIVGLMQNWSAPHLRENYLYLIRLMYFRSIGGS